MQSSVSRWLTLVELLAANSCHWGFAYLDNRCNRKWCDGQVNYLNNWGEGRKPYLLQRASLFPEESGGINIFSSCFSSTWNNQSHSSIQIYWFKEVKLRKLKKWDHSACTKMPRQVDSQADRSPGEGATGCSSCDWLVCCSSEWGLQRQSCLAGSDSPSANQVNWSGSHGSTGTCQTHQPCHNNRKHINPNPTHLYDTPGQWSYFLYRRNLSVSPHPAAQRIPSQQQQQIAAGIFRCFQVFSGSELLFHQNKPDKKPNSRPEQVFGSKVKEWKTWKQLLRVSSRV